MIFFYSQQRKQVRGLILKKERGKRPADLRFPLKVAVVLILLTEILSQPQLRSQQLYAIVSTEAGTENRMLSSLDDLPCFFFPYI